MRGRLVLLLVCAAACDPINLLPSNTPNGRPVDAGTAPHMLNDAAAASDGVIVTDGALAPLPDGFVPAVDAAPTGVGNWIVGATLPQSFYPAAGFASAASTNGRIYFVGGLGGMSATDASEPWSANFIYDPATNSLSRGADAPFATYWGTMAEAADGRLYYMGGLTADGASLENAAAIYDPTQDSWTTIASTPTRHLEFTATFGANGRLFVFGGYGGSYNRVEEYNPATDSWSTVAPLPTARIAASSILGHDGKIYVIGGEDMNNVALTAVEAYDPVSDQWSTVQNMLYPRFYPGVVIGSDGNFQVIGGYQLGTGQMVQSPQTAESLIGGSWVKLSDPGDYPNGAWTINGQTVALVNATFYTFSP